MNEKCLIVQKIGLTATECTDILFAGINVEAEKAKGLKPIYTFCFSIENIKNEIVGGINGIVYYGCLHIDMLWVTSRLRGKGWGTKLMQEAESLGKEKRCTFATVSTMDWEALPFYENLGYTIEFVREGYQENSRMYLLRKKL